VNERILLIDDDPSVHEVARAYLEREGYIVYSATDGRDGLELGAIRHPALFVLDLMLPDMSGDAVLQEIRRRSQVPVLMLSGRAGADERVQGLSLGADDYLTKPFSPRELVARVRAVLRRHDTARTGDVIRAGDLALDLPRMRVTRGSEPIELTATEFALLAAMARHPGRVFTRSQLLDAIHGVAFDSFQRAIDAHVKNIRRKLEPDPARPRYLVTVYGVGYRVAEPEQRAG
jgi:DNA-binding response OmpR family regulator